MNERAIQGKFGRTGPIGRVALFVALACALMASVLAAPITAMADTVFDPDGDETGSLTLYKYDLGEDGTFVEDAVTQDQIKGALTQIQQDYTPIQGVVFSYLRVGGVTQYIDEDDGQVTIGYSVSNTYWNDLGLTQDMADYEDGGTYYFSIKTLSDALANLTQYELETFMSDNSATPMDATDANGETTASNLQLGLYLVVETSYPSSTYMTTEPFFVSIPMTDKTDDGEWTWTTEVVAIPKNRTESFGISKSVVENGHETNAIDAEIGQSSTFVLRADVPSAIYNMNTYTITDTLDDGLTLSGTPTVYGLTMSGGRTQLTEGAEYRFSANGQVLTFTFDGTQMGTDGTTDYAMVEIRYDAYLNADAVIGGEGNVNDAYLTYSRFTNQTGQADVTEDTAHVSATVYTYGIDLLKYAEGDIDDTLDGVTFELYRDEALTEKIDVAQSDDETYYYIAGSTDGSPVTSMQTSDGGKLVIRGLEAGTYYLKETGTLDGYSLLVRPIEITITSNEATFDQSDAGSYVQTSTSGSYYLTAAGERWQFELPSGTDEGAYVNFGAHAVYGSADADAAALTTYAPQEYTASCADFTLDTESGMITLYVENSEDFNLPLTGGKALPWLLVGGAIVVVATISMKAAARKKDDVGA